MAIDTDESYLRVYIAGPMTGWPEFNFPAFDKAEATLTAAGYKYVHNPAVIGRLWGTGRPHSFYMRKAIEKLLQSDAIIMLRGWEKSRGARLELQIARTLNLKELPFPIGQLAPTHGSAAATTEESNSHGNLSNSSNSATDTEYHKFTNDLIRSRYDHRFDK